jgi:hypothetical protein
MKQRIVKRVHMGIITVMLLCFYCHAAGQLANTAPAWVPEHGYWIVETNLHVPRQYIIRFYNDAHVLVSTLSVSNKTMRLGRTKTRMQLKEMLESSLRQWAAKQGSTDSSIVKKP